MKQNITIPKGKISAFSYFKNIKYSLILISFIIIKFWIQYHIINSEYELHRDEYLHLDQGKHLEWGYLSVPPFTSWLSYIIILFGNSVFWVKFFPSLFGAMTIWIVWEAIKELKGNIFALILGTTAITFSILVRINTLYQPNSFEIMTWTLFYLILIKYLNSGNGKWLVAAGIAFGIAFLNKYNIVFLIMGLIPSFLITNEKRIFLNKYFYIGLLAGLLIISPNLYWQYKHHFVVFHHLSTLAKTQLVNVSRFDFLKEQALFFMGSIFILIAAFTSFFTYKPFRKFKVVLWSYIFTILIFLLLKAKGYYAIGLYPIFLAFGSVYIERLFRIRAGVLLRPLSLFVIIFTFIAFLNIEFPILTPEQIVDNPEDFKKFGLLRWEDGKEHMIPQDFADMVGWKELAHIVDSCYEKQPDKIHTAILCNNYGEAGAINYYSRYKNINAVTQNADYIDWFDLDKPILQVISVKDSKDPDSLRQKEKPYFEKIEYVGKIENLYSREKGTTIFIFEKPKLDINQLLIKEIAKTKKEHSE